MIKVNVKTEIEINIKLTDINAIRELYHRLNIASNKLKGYTSQQIKWDFVSTSQIDELFNELADVFDEYHIYK